MARTKHYQAGANTHKSEKRAANKRVRRYHREMSNGRMFVRLFPSWDIRDWRYNPRVLAALVLSDNFFAPNVDTPTVRKGIAEADRYLHKDTLYKRRRLRKKAAEFRKVMSAYPYDPQSTADIFMD